MRDIKSMRRRERSHPVREFVCRDVCPLCKCQCMGTVGHESAHQCGKHFWQTVKAPRNVRVFVSGEFC